MKLKDNIKSLRKRDGMTQGDLAKKLKLKQYNISDYEIGRIEPSIAILIKIADIFDVSVDYLIGRKAKEDENESEIKIDSPSNDKYLNKIKTELEDLSDDQKRVIVDLVHFSIGNMLK